MVNRFEEDSFCSTNLFFVIRLLSSVTKFRQSIGGVPLLKGTALEPLRWTGLWLLRAASPLGMGELGGV
ncbi:hypothetical protein FACHB389_24480 [Nostoc calcicola FACHB-389]|nr:hypothetical protein FACHB389_24480 [Nostoc calcicola FACHB-389]